MKTYPTLLQKVFTCTETMEHVRMEQSLSLPIPLAKGLIIHLPCKDVEGRDRKYMHKINDFVYDLASDSYETTEHEQVFSGSDLERSIASAIRAGYVRGKDWMRES